MSKAFATEVDEENMTVSTLMILVYDVFHTILPLQLNPLLFYWRGASWFSRNVSTLALKQGCQETYFWSTGEIVNYCTLL